MHLISDLDEIEDTREEEEKQEWEAISEEWSDNLYQTGESDNGRG